MTPTPLLWDETFFEPDDFELEAAFEDFLENFDDILSAISKEGRFYIAGRNMGWRKRSGHLTLTASNATQFIAGAFPQTAEWTFRGAYDPASLTLEYTLFHHDAPTGEFYTVRASDDLES
jgi:hypothetical protein